MKKLLTILVLSLLLSGNGYANDVRDFQLYKISIGDSALDHFSEDKIKKFTHRNWYKNKKLLPVEFPSDNEDFNGIGFLYKNGDSKYQILSFDVSKNYSDMKECNKRLKKEAKLVAETFPDLIKHSFKTKHAADKSKKSKTWNTAFDFKSGARIKLSCVDWSKEMKYQDHFRMEISSLEFMKWIETAHN